MGRGAGELERIAGDECRGVHDVNEGHGGVSEPF